MAVACFPPDCPQCHSRPPRPATGGRGGELAGWSQSRNGKWTRRASAEKAWGIPDHWFPRYECYHHYVLREPSLDTSLPGRGRYVCYHHYVLRDPSLDTSLPGRGSASVNAPPRPTTHGLRSGPDLLYGPSRALDEILMWADQRHRGRGHEMRHVVGLLLATNRRREQLSRALMAWLLQAPAGAP